MQQNLHRVLQREKMNLHIPCKWVTIIAARRLASTNAQISRESTIIAESFTTIHLGTGVFIALPRGVLEWR